MKKARWGPDLFDGRKVEGQCHACKYATSINSMSNFPREKPHFTFNPKPSPQLSYLFEA